MSHKARVSIIGAVVSIEGVGEGEEEQIPAQDFTQYSIEGVGRYFSTTPSIRKRTVGPGGIAAP